jgi:cysteinyl-tRNA synthetase
MNTLETLNKLTYVENASDFIHEEDKMVQQLCNECTIFLNDDFNTAMSMASLFELSSKIFSWQHQQLKNFLH